MGSPELRRKYYASKKRFIDNRKKQEEIRQRGEDFNQNQEERGNVSKKGGKRDRRTLSKKTLPRSHDQAGEIKNSLRAFIESSINMASLNHPSRSRHHAKRRPGSMDANPEGEMVPNTQKAKNCGQESIMNRGSNKLIRSMKSEKNQRFQGSKKSFGQPQKHPVRDHLQRHVPTSQKDYSGFSRLSSFGQKILIKNHRKGFLSNKNQLNK